jgi:hypothetical protein
VNVTGLRSGRASARGTDNYAVTRWITHVTSGTAGTGPPTSSMGSSEPKQPQDVEQNLALQVAARVVEVEGAEVVEAYRVRRVLCGRVT